MNRARTIGADLPWMAALLVALPGAWIAPRWFFASWLAAWWFWVGVALGALASAWIHVLTGGRWGLALRRGALPLARRLPWLLVLFLPLAAGLPQVFPWASDPAADWTRGIAEPGFLRTWFTPTFFWGRMAFYALVWWAIARRGTFERKGRAAAAIVVHAVTGTLATFDLVVSLVPGWHSAAHGLVNLVGGALGGAGLTVALVALRWPHVDPVPPARPAVPPPPPVWRDLGNLLLMWLMLWAYVAFVEFLILWSENIPREVSWIALRSGGWAWIGAGLAALQFGGGFLALLSRRVKDDPRRLAAVAAALAAGQLVDVAWLVLPSVDPHGWFGWWLVPALALAMGGPLVSRAWGDLADARGPEPARAGVRRSHA